VPRTTATLTAVCDSAAQACELARTVQRRGLAVRAASLGGDGDTFALTLDLAGSPAAVERSRRDIAELARSASARIDAPGTLPEPFLEDESLLCKLSVLPSRLPGLIAGLETLEAPRLLAYPTIGVCRAAWPTPANAEATVDRVRALAAEAGGSVVVERCPLDLKRRIDVFGAPPPSFELMRRVKEQFDAKGVLSPGRFVGRL